MEPAGQAPAPGLFARLTAAEALAAAGSGVDGLREDEAETRLRRHGANAVPRTAERRLARALLDEFVHFFAVLLWVAAAFAYLAGTPELAVAIVVVVVVNGVFSFFQEYRADRTTRALAALLPGRACVVRAGRQASVSVAEVVPGDLLVLREGDRVAADARLVEATGLCLDLSLLTGESAPVPRTEAATAAGAAAKNLVLAGTFVASGTGRAVVFATGALTELAGLSRLAGRVVRRPTPLRLELAHAVRVIAAAALGAGAAFFGASMVLRLPVHNALVFAVGVVVALVPEGLLPTLTLSLAMSARRMAARRALVKRLDAVETLGAVTVICSDKTGTMTAHEMTARVLWVAGRRLSVTGHGYGPEGTLLLDGRPLSDDERAAVLPALYAAGLCGNAAVVRDGGRWGARGDATEAALLVLARKGGVEREAVERFLPRVREFPFDSIRRRMSTVHLQSSGRLELFCKGSTEAVLAACRAVADRSGAEVPLDGPARERLTAQVDGLADEGLRVLALARGNVARLPGTPEEAERELVLVGLVGIADPVRPEVPGAVAACARAGIRVLMVTGDHPATAAAIGRAAGLPEGRVLTGAELPEDEEALGALLAGPVSVLARVAPDQKLRIARALQRRGEVVAMTGDGVNDAPALRQADVGVAMGLSGTDVAREAADVVLLDDDFSHIIAAVEEGRATFDNVRRFLTYHLTDNVSELAPFAAWALSGGRFPLVIGVLQILALDIGTDLLPALALGAERPDPRTMGRAPRKRRAPMLDRGVLLRAFGFLGPVQASLTLALVPLLAALRYGWRPGAPFPRSPQQVVAYSSVVFTAIVLAQLVNAFECRDEVRGVREVRPFGNRLLVAAVVVELLLLTAFLYAPAVARALGNGPPGPRGWLLALAAAAAFLVAEETRKRWVRRSFRGRSSTGARPSRR